MEESMKRPIEGTTSYAIYIELVNRLKAGVPRKKLFVGLDKKLDVKFGRMEDVYRRFIKPNLKNHNIKELY
jgi:hypothetical protein